MTLRSLAPEAPLQNVFWLPKTLNSPKNIVKVVLSQSIANESETTRDMRESE